MSELAIKVEGVGKEYRLCHEKPHDSLRELASDGLGRLLRCLKAPSGERADRVADESFWALRDVSFDLKRGEILGVIGRNGAGKSTLLKILSRITEVSEGSVSVYGRIGSLLEVGTGFHPELTGRENIYLNGAIIGMKRVEIRKKFDQIVAFAEVERFLDTPVKHYSSGMYTRLAFSVAAHLEPDILIMDEVLAVGDYSFQKKCLGKMGEVAHDGRTIIFVSHSIPSIRSLCTTCIWLKQGKIESAGPTASVITKYLDLSGAGKRNCVFEAAADPTKPFQLIGASILDGAGRQAEALECDDDIFIHLQCQCRSTVRGLHGYLQVSRDDGTVAMVSDSFDPGANPLDPLLPGMHGIQVAIPRRTLAAGDYTVLVNFSSNFNTNGSTVDSPGDILSFRLDDNATRRGNNRAGFFSTRLDWTVHRDGSVD